MRGDFDERLIDPAESYFKGEMYRIREIMRAHGFQLWPGNTELLGPSLFEKNGYKICVHIEGIGEPMAADFVLKLPRTADSLAYKKAPEELAAHLATRASGE